MHTQTQFGKPPLASIPLGYDGAHLDEQTIAVRRQWRPASGHPGGWRVVREWPNYPSFQPAMQELEGRAGRRTLFASYETAKRRADRLNATAPLFQPVKHAATFERGLSFWAEPNGGGAGAVESYCIVSQVYGHPATEACDDWFAHFKDADEIAAKLARGESLD